MGKVPKIITDLVTSNHALPAYTVLDFACGTGLIGEELANVGFGKIDGCDISKASLAYIEEAKPGVYSALKAVDMNEFPYPYEDNQFMYVVSGGSLNYADDPHAVLT